jgi:hypothetical protein
MSEHADGEHMEDARADLADLQAKRRRGAARDIPVEVVEGLAGIRRELRGIKHVLWVLGIVAFLALVAFTS